METQIKKFAKEIAKEISERSIMDVENVALMIEIRLKHNMVNFVDEYSTKEELEYLKMLNEQSKNKIGSNQYISLGYKLSAAKQKKASANRAANNIRKEDNYERLKQFVIGKFGRNEFDLFLTQEVPQQPLYSTD